MSGISRQYRYFIENNKSKVTIDKLEKIAKILEIRVWQLIKLAEEQ